MTHLECRYSLTTTLSRLAAVGCGFITVSVLGWRGLGAIEEGRTSKGASKGVTVKNVRQVSEKLSVTGQVQPDQLKQAIQEGFKSVFNLRSPDELGFANDEQQFVEALGLHYAHMPLKLEAIDDDLITAILNQLEHIPKPAIVHCAAGFRSASIAILSIAIQEGLTPEQTLAKARQLGFDFFDYACINPQLKQRFVQYVNGHAKVAAIAS